MDDPANGEIDATMKHQKPIEYDALVWVKPELNALLERAREALAAFADEPDRTDLLNAIVKIIRQVRGTLQVVDLVGATRLASEIEALLDALIADHVGDCDVTLGVLSVAVLKLPDYLEYLHTGHPDTPLILLPLLNDLRAARGADLLSENQVFVPAFMVAEKPDSATQSQEQPEAIVTRERYRYQLGLLSLLRDRQDEHSLQGMRAALSTVQKASQQPLLQRLWWVAGALVETLDEKPAPTAIKMLLGQLDREMRTILEHGEQTAVNGLSSDLLKNLLYYVGRSTHSNPLTDAIRKAFQLDASLPDENQLELARCDLAAPGLKLLETVSDAIQEDLGSIRDQLEVVTRGGDFQSDKMMQIPAQLRKIGDTFAMLGLEDIYVQIVAEATRLNAALENNTELDLPFLLNLAQTLLQASESLHHFLQEHKSGNLQRSDAVDNPELTAAGVREVLRDIARVKEALNASFDASLDHADLAFMPKVLTDLIAALSVMNVNQPLPRLERVRQQVSLLIDLQASPPQIWEDTLAEAISAIEMYLEQLAGQLPEQPGFLERADQALTSLDMLDIGAESKTIESTSGGSVAEEPGLAEMEIMPQPGVQITENEGSQPPVGLQKASEKPEAQSLSKQSVELSELRLIRPDTEPEILETFIEEAEEETDRIAEMLSQLHQHPDANELLVTMRRSFHTLKGSGRLAGAELLGEFAQVYENMLNRILDHTIEMRPEHTDLLNVTLPLLRELIEKMKGNAVNPVLSLNPIELMQRAEALAYPLATDKQVSATTITHLSESSESQDHRQKIREMIAELNDFLNAIYGGGVIWIDDSMPRILEQLAELTEGMAIQGISQVFAQLSDLISEFKDGARPLPQRMLSLFQKAVTLADSSITAKPDAGALSEDAKRLSKAILVMRSELGLESGQKLDEVEKSADETSFREPIQNVISKRVQEPASEVDESASEPEQHLELEMSGPDLTESLDQDLVSIFLEEADTLLSSLDSALQDWKREPDGKKVSVCLQRDLHTLKGSARMAGFANIGNLAHALETCIAHMLETMETSWDAELSLIQSGVDQIAGMLQLIRKGQPVYPLPLLIKQLISLRSPQIEIPATPRLSIEGTIPTPPAESLPSDVHEVPIVSEEVESPLAAARPKSSKEAVLSPITVELETERQASVRVSPESLEPIHVSVSLLDKLVNYTAEVNIYHAQMQQQIGQFGFNLGELQQTIDRLRMQLRSLEQETEAQILHRFQNEQIASQTENRADFDPLELDRYSNIQQLSRALAESVNDLGSIDDLLLEETRKAEDLLVQQRRVSIDLQEGLIRSRIVRFGGLTPRLNRVVRQTAQALGKQVELVVTGDNVEIDRSILDQLSAPLEHLLRNALVHGVEAPDDRRLMGKPESGRIAIAVSREGSEIVLSVADDGRGIDFSAIREKGIAKGLIHEDEAPPDRQIIGLILESGFSTAEKVDQIAGRGVGLDVVRHTIKQLGGVMNVTSQSGQGTQFTFRLPYTLSITQALLAQAGEHLYALPMTGVQSVVRLPITELREIYAGQSRTFDYAGDVYEIQPLELLMGGGDAPPSGHDGGYCPLLLLRSGGNRVAIQVDRLLGSREVVIKPLGGQFSRLRGISGATILGDGSVAMILDAADLARLPGTRRLKPLVTAEAAKPAVHKRPLIMIVDDSITIRKVTQRVLERNGYEVVTARDGVDSLTQLEERTPDLVLTDIEMPRMDGYELASHIRNVPRLHAIPIAMITSRSGEKHRKRALDMGVDRYLGKPYQEQDLLGIIQELLASRSQSETSRPLMQSPDQKLH